MDDRELNASQLSGIIEVDEVFVGSAPKYEKRVKNIERERHQEGYRACCCGPQWSS